jgi:hypothetical protein
MTQAEIEAIADRAAKTATAETLRVLGIDTAQPFEMQRDFAHLRSWRLSVEAMRTKTILTAVGIVVTGVLGAVWLAIKGH